MAVYLEAQQTQAAPTSLSIQVPALPAALAAGSGNLLPGNLLSLTQEVLKILQRLREQVLATPLFATE